MTFAAQRHRVRGLYHRFQSSKPLQATVWYVAGTVIEKFFGFLVLFLIVRLLTPHDVGIYSIVLNWRGILTILLTVNLTFSVTAAFFDFGSEEFSKFLSSIVSLGWFIALGCVLIIVLFSREISVLLGIDGAYLPLILFWIAGALPYEIKQAEWKANYTYQRYTRARIFVIVGQYVFGVGLMLIMRAVLPVSSDVWFLLAGVSALVLSLGLSIGFNILRQGLVFINLEYWRYALLISVPLLFHVLSHAVLARADQIMILNTLGEEAVGLYSVAYRFGEISILVWSAISNVWVVWFKQQVTKENYQRIRRMSLLYSAVFGIITIILIFIGMIGILVLLPSFYHETIKLIPMIAASGFFSVMYSFYVTIEYYEKRSVQTALVTFMAAVANIALNALLLPRWGYIAAAWATLASYILIFLLHVFYVEVIMKKYYINTPVLLGFGAGMVGIVTVFAWILA